MKQLVTTLAPVVFSKLGAYLGDHVQQLDRPRVLHEGLVRSQLIEQQIQLGLAIYDWRQL